MVLNTEWAQVEVIDLINDGSGLAFGIIGGRSTGVVVKTIIPGGVADRDGRLQSGDHILQIGEVNLRGLGSEQVASVLRQCGVHVRMVVARPVESTSADYKKLGSHAPIVPTKILGDPVELDKHLNYNGYGECYMQSNPSNSYSTPYIYSGQQQQQQQSDAQLQTISGMVDVVRNPLPIGSAPSILVGAQSLPAVASVNLLPLDMALRNDGGTSSSSAAAGELPETETYFIDLVKDELGLGITVAGYVCEKEEISGIFVKSISKGSAADLSGRIKINDRIIEVNGLTVVGHNNHEAVEILRKAGCNVRIQFERYLRGPKFEQLQQAILANEYRPISPPSPSASSLPKIPLSLVHMSSLGIEPEAESRTSIDFDSAILLDYEPPPPVHFDDVNQIIIDTTDGRRSVQFSICSHESIYEKWRETFSEDVQIVIAEMVKEPTSGLGISLEGTVDVEDGREVRPHHYIRNILPHGPVGQNAILQSGDELLEVNGIRLLGLNHLEVVSILKQLPSLVILVCARYSLRTRIIDTAQHKDAFQARNILAGSFNTLMSSDRLVKAKSDTSIASTVASEPCCSVGSRSRSLELIAGLPMWTTEPTVVVLNKGEHGLGFSILDYQDPLNAQETVIVIRSLVPGGVAQQDGNLIPGDRLLAVNDVDVEHAVLDRAVQVLKGAAKGPVKITVAKPLSGKDAGSYHSQDTEDDQTCIEDFQECIEEYQECLEVVQICIEDDRSPQHHPAQRAPQQAITAAGSDLVQRYMDDAPNSEPEISYKSICDITNSTNSAAAPPTTLPPAALAKVDSLERASKTDSEKDGYETCLDESFSEEMARTPTNDAPPPPIPTFFVETNTGITVETLEMEIEQVSKELAKISKKKEHLNKKSANRGGGGEMFEMQDMSDAGAAQTNLNMHSSSSNLAETNLDSFKPPAAVISPPAPCMDALHDNELPIITRQRLTSSSDPCLNYEYSKCENHICLDTNPSDDELKSYDAMSTSTKEDEFFLLQYPDDLTTAPGTTVKCRSEPNVLDKNDLTPVTYRYKIEEYYNDIDDCLEAYRQAKLEEETKQRAIEEEKLRLAEEQWRLEQEQQRLFEEQCQREMDAIEEQKQREETTRKQQEKLLRQQAEEAKKLADEKRRHAEDLLILAEQKRLIQLEIEEKRIQEEQRILQEAERIRLEDLKRHEKERKRQEAERKREEETKRKLAEEERKREEELQRQREAEEIRRQAEEEKRLQLEAETAKKREEEERQLAMERELEEARLQEEAEARQRVEDEERRKRWEVENEERRMEKLKKLGIEKIESTEKPSIVSPMNASLKSKSAPEILDNSFVTMTYDPGPVDLGARRKSNYPDEKQLRENVVPMTVQRIIDNNSAVMRSIGVESMLGKNWGAPRTVEIHREAGTSLGISIVGGKVDLHKESASETILGIFIKNVVPNSPAGRDGQLKTGDRILEVCGTSLKDVSHERAVEVIKYAKNPVVFIVQSLNTDQDIELTAKELPTTPIIAKQDKPLPSQKSVDFKETVEVNDIAPRRQKTIESSEESDDEEDVRNLTGRTVSAKGQEIDRASAANIKRSKEEAAADPDEEDDFGYTNHKVKKKYASLGQQILMVQLERSAGQGLGLSLAGHKDRNCMAVFVCGINPAGAAHRAGNVQVGDEILEVNGVVLHGRCHLNASAIIKGLSGPIFKLIILRRKAAIDDIAVRPITQFPVSLAEEASEESFSNYPNVRTVAIKKGNQSLGIMIIEGKHAEVGQGIFISDIQEGSSAEKAGLEIGEMILAVNKDSLLGSNYDTAANLLKRTEGLVTLVVSNPGKNKNALNDDRAGGKGLKAGSATSRPTTPTPEPPADPLSCPIAPGRDTTIEVASDNKALGICFVGGKDTPIPGGIMVVDVYPGGAADKDGRLRPGDQIVDVNGTSLKDVTHNFASQALRQTLPKMKIVVHRSEKEEYDNIDVEFTKKPGKGLGLSIAGRRCEGGKGVYVTEILSGGCADVDGKVNRGDLLVSVNGQSLATEGAEDVSAVLKTLSGKVSLKLHRYRPTAAPAAGGDARPSTTR